MNWPCHSIQINVSKPRTPTRPIGSPTKRSTAKKQAKPSIMPWCVSNIRIMGWKESPCFTKVITVAIFAKVPIIVRTSWLLSIRSCQSGSPASASSFTFWFSCLHCGSGVTSNAVQFSAEFPSCIETIFSHVNKITKANDIWWAIFGKKCLQLQNTKNWRCREIAKNRQRRPAAFQKKNRQPYPSEDVYAWFQRMRDMTAGTDSAFCNLGDVIVLVAARATNAKLF